MTDRQKIIFIIQGEGRGHLTQAIRVKEILEKRGIEISRVFFGTSPQRNTPDYINIIFGNRLKFFRSPNFLSSKNLKGISLARSVIYNLLRVGVYINSINSLRKMMDSGDEEVVINFYDVLGGFAYRFSRKRMKYFVLSHHYYFENSDFPQPENFLVQKVLLKIHNIMASGKSGNRIALSFVRQEKFGQTAVIPPFIRSDISVSESKFDGKILVYLLYPGLLADLLPLFRKFTDTRFLVFTDKLHDFNFLPENVIHGSIHRKDFRDALISCSAIIATAGFETVCEAAFLNKPVFLIPSTGHYEQAGNRNDAIRNNLAYPYTVFNPQMIPPAENNEFRDWCKENEKLFIQVTGL